MGTVGMALTLPSGESVSQVNFELRNGGGSLVASGSVPVPSPRAVLSAIIGKVPAGKSYVIQLTATNVGGGVTCSGSATFDVVASETTSVDVVLRCQTPSNNGSVIVNGHLDICPRLTSFTAGPRTLPVGQAAALSAAATDPDPGDVITFAWTATSGTFDNAAGSKTTFTCASPGVATVSAAVSDGSCSDVATFDITCLSLCGDGKLDPGEQCDPPNGGTCGSDCLLAAKCGNGIVEPGEQCDPPHPGYYYGNLLACSSTCQATKCGNGALDPGEGCEPADRGWTPGHGSSSYCNGYCVLVDACAECIASCGSLCNAFAGPIKDACAAAAACIQRSPCTGAITCSSCSSQVNALSGSASDPSTPLGAAARMGGCMVNACHAGPYSAC
jgi:hypothetical protein